MRNNYHCFYKCDICGREFPNEHVKQIRADLLRGIDPAVSRTIAKWSE